MKNTFQILEIQQLQEGVQITFCVFICCREIFVRRISIQQCQFYGRQGMQGRETSVADAEDPKVRC